MIRGVPFDIWLQIAAFSTVESLLSLRGTCRYLYEVMDERSVWNTALHDITEVIPLRGLRYTMPSMSSGELKNKAITMARLERLWSCQVAIPKKIERHLLDPDICRVEFILGGNWILTLRKDGTLQLHQNRNLAEPRVTVHRIEDPSRNYFPDNADMRRSISSRGENWAVVLDHYLSEYEEWSDFRVYRIDIAIPSLILVTTVTRRDYCFDFHAREDRLAATVRGDETHHIVVRRLFAFSGEAEEEAVLDLGPDMTDPRTLTSIICAHMLLVSTPSDLYLYQAPKLVPISPDIESHALVASPLAIYGPQRPNDGRMIWDTVHHDGRIATYTYSSDEESLLILPPPGGNEDDIVRYVLDGPCSMGNSRAVGCRLWVDQEPMELQCFTHFTRPDNHFGYARLGLSKAPEPSHYTSISLVGQNGRVEDLTWDEESGRICLIFSPWHDRTTREMLMIDMIS